MKNKGFTLIELLAVIIILGVIMLIAIPSVTRYINDSRKDTYIDTARQIVKGAIPMVNGGELDMYDTNTTYYIPASCIPTENAMSSPFGEFEQAYVIVGYTGEGYEYYWASVDSAHQGIEMKDYNKLTKNDVKSNIESIDTTIGIGNRSDIKILNEENCQHFESSEGNNTTPTVQAIVYPEGKTKETVRTGDIVKIDTEEFYVVKHIGNDLVLLSHYNLNVGSKKKSGATEGIQNSEVKGETEEGINTWYGMIAFSSTNYWNGKIGTDYPGNLCRFRGTNCAYVYDSNSNLKTYVDNYKTYLEGKGANIKEARLLRVEEAFNLGCETTHWTCNSAPAFIIETSYWFGSARDESGIWCVFTGGQFDRQYYARAEAQGIRPVIVI